MDMLAAPLRRITAAYVFYLFAVLPGTVFAAPAASSASIVPSASPSAPAVLPNSAPVAWRALQPGLDLATIQLGVAELPPPQTVLAEPPLMPSTPAPAETRPPGSAPEPASSSAPGPATNSTASRPAPAPASSAASGVVVTVLRIDPARYTFSLHMASEETPLSLPALAEKHGLAAAINAGMYLPDGKTSTGHLRSETHTNNPRVAGNFGAFFLANPKDSTLPRARLADRSEDDWQKLLEQYTLVMQNYRMNTAQGRIIWKDDRPHSIAALSQDNKGNVLFFMCREPVPAAAFASAMLRRPLGLRTLMYLEGGSEAAMLVKAGDVNEVFVGRYGRGWGPSGSTDIVLPNVLGVKPRAAGQ